MIDPSLQNLPLLRYRDGTRTACEDAVAVEAALELRLSHPRLGPVPVTVATTMRTPGHDEELVLGHLYAESLVDGIDQVHAIRRCGGPGDALRVELAPETAAPDLSRMQRLGTLTSACGACGKADTEALLAQSVRARVAGDAGIRTELLQQLPERLRAAQRVFAATGGVHAAGLFDAQGSLLAWREDVGRHNALDKLVGHALRERGLPWTDRVLVLSGRASFELLQKAARAGVSMVAAVGAPSSLAVAVAELAGITLLGFLSARGFNVYSGAARIQDR